MNTNTESTEAAPSPPTLEKVIGENVSLKRQLAAAQAEILRLQNLALSFEVTTRTLSSMVGQISLVQPAPRAQ